MKKLKNNIINKLNNKIDDWHKGRSCVGLREYLGMTKKEYSIFIKGESEYIKYLNENEK